VEVLAPDPADDVLEVGCGTGVAAELIFQRLTSGKLTAIDRSAAMIKAAERRNRAAVSLGKARFQNVALEEAEFAGERFDRVLAVHVNRFWLKPVDESDLWAPLLKPRGLVCLVYQPPSGQTIQRVADACSDYFHRSGFSEVRVLTAEFQPTAVCISATWA
jgi:ubiquinone/menaquinone biosynthesis C-methylase UbiE